MKVCEPFRYIPRVWKTRAELLEIYGEDDMSDEKPMAGDYIFFAGDRDERGAPVDEKPNDEIKWFARGSDGIVILNEGGSIRDEIPIKVAADAKAMLELLRRYEFGGTALGTDYCLSCRAWEGTPHVGECAWGALLDKHGRG